MAGSGTALLDSVMFTSDGAGLVLDGAADSTSLAIAIGATFALAGLDAPGLTGPDIALVADGASGTLLQYYTGGHINAPVVTAATSATWHQPQNGSVTAGDNWVTGTTPAAGALLTFPNAATPYEAVFDETHTAYNAAAAAAVAGFAVTGGDLALTNTLDAVASPPGDDTAMLSLAAAGALQADAGALTIGTGLGTLAGTLEGDGEIMLGGSKILGPGADIVVATLALTGTTSLAGNLFVLGASFHDQVAGARCRSAQLGGTLEGSGELALAGSRAGAALRRGGGGRRTSGAGRAGCICAGAAVSGPVPSYAAGGGGADPGTTILLLCDGSDIPAIDRVLTWLLTGPALSWPVILVAGAPAAPVAGYLAAALFGFLTTEPRFGRSTRRLCR